MLLLQPEMHLFKGVVVRCSLGKIHFCMLHFRQHFFFLSNNQNYQRIAS